MLDNCLLRIFVLSAEFEGVGFVSKIRARSFRPTHSSGRWTRRSHWLVACLHRGPHAKLRLDFFSSFTHARRAEREWGLDNAGYSPAATPHRGCDAIVVSSGGWSSRAWCRLQRTRAPPAVALICEAGMAVGEAISTAPMVVSVFLQSFLSGMAMEPQRFLCH